MAKQYPNHIFIIPDGNRRYANKYNVSLAETYTLGAKKGVEILDYLLMEQKTPILSIYAASFENITKRENDMVATALLSQVKVYSDWLGSDRFDQFETQIRFIGQIQVLPDSIQHTIKFLEEKTKHHKKHLLNILIAYSDQLELLHVVRNLANHKELLVKDLTIDAQKEFIKKFLHFFHVPHDVDLMIRTGGEQRISNGLLFQCAFAELHFLRKLIAETTIEDIKNAIDDFSQRKRNFGK